MICDLETSNSFSSFVSSVDMGIEFDLYQYGHTPCENMHRVDVQYARPAFRDILKVIKFFTELTADRAFESDAQREAFYDGLTLLRRALRSTLWRTDECAVCWFESLTKSSVATTLKLIFWRFTNWRGGEDPWAHWELLGNLLLKENEKLLGRLFDWLLERHINFREEDEQAAYNRFDPLRLPLRSPMLLYWVVHDIQESCWANTEENDETA
jgi:hypothetical protein